MEKVFTLTHGNNGSVVLLDKAGVATEIKTFIIIQSWDSKDQSWYWVIRLLGINNGKGSIAMELCRDGEVVYTPREVKFGKNGTGLIVGAGKPYVRALNVSVIRFMWDKGILTTERNLPEVASRWVNNASLRIRVFDAESGEEQKPLADTFSLDPERPYVVHYRRVKGSVVKEWDSLYVPPQFRFGHTPAKTEAEKNEEILDNEGFVHTESHEMLGCLTGEQIKELEKTTNPEPGDQPVAINVG